MVDQKLLDWINSQKKGGYSEQQIRAHLVNQKYNLTDIYEALNESKKISTDSKNKASPKKDPKLATSINKLKNVKDSLHKALMENGLVYASIFYALLIFYLMPTLISIGASIYFKKYFGLIFPAIFLIIISSMLLKKKIFALLILFFFFNPFIFSVFQLIPLVHAFSDIPNSTIYFLVFLYSIVLGGIMSFMFNYSTESNGKYIGAGLFANLTLSIIFSFNQLITLTILKIQGLFTRTAGVNVDSITGPMKYYLLLTNAEPASTHITFILALIFFNLPFIYFYKQRENKNYYLLLLYLIPVLIYIVLAYIFKVIIDKIMANPMQIIQELINMFL